jgi:pSer/pThr/pTyr-binding forkhead associated (FHA) protein
LGVLLLRFLVGLLSGLAVWAVMEPFFPRVVTAGTEWAAAETRFILVLGAVIGASVGGLNGYFQGSTRHALRGLGLGLVFGAAGIMLGYRIGGTLAQLLFGPLALSGSNVAAVIPARMLALVPMGLFLGAAIGASSLTWRRTVQGAIGGALGAGLGAGAFDAVSLALAPMILAMRGQTAGEVGIVGRGLTAMFMGGGIALFIGIVERAMRSAWLRLSLGRNEGKEWSLDSAQNFIGRSETAHVPLFGDPGIAPIHACVVRHGKHQYAVYDNGTGATFVNGYPVQQAALTHGDRITLGQTTLDFLMKAGAAPVRGPEAYRGQAYPVGGGQAPYPAPAHPATAPGVAPMQPVQGPTTAIPAQRQVPTLVALDGPLIGQRFEVRGPMDVGRDCPSIPMSFDGSASRRHAALAPAPDGVRVQDLGSTNGTFVDGHRATSATVRPGQTVKIGATTFRLEG